MVWPIDERQSPGDNPAWPAYLKSTPASPDIGNAPHNIARTSEPLAYLYEPDPAVLRAGLVGDLAARLDAFQLDVDIAYLTADKKQPTPFARAWAIEAWFPFGLKRLRFYLREHGVGRITVKKRGSPLKPEALIHDLSPSLKAAVLCIRSTASIKSCIPKGLLGRGWQIVYRPPSKNGNYTESNDE